jgi:hypothetical protein
VSSHRKPSTSNIHLEPIPIYLRLTIHERYIKVQTYFKLDELYAERLIQGAVRQTLLNIG